MISIGFVHVSTCMYICIHHYITSTGEVQPNIAVTFYYYLNATASEYYQHHHHALASPPKFKDTKICATIWVSALKAPVLLRALHLRALQGFA